MGRNTIMWIQKILEINIVQGILLLILGWLMGLLSPIVVDGIKKRRQVKQIIMGIQIELSEVRIKLAATAGQLAFRFGGFDRPFLIWLKSVIKSYNGLHVDKNAEKNIEKLLKNSDEEIEHLSQSIKAPPQTSIDIRRYKIPFLDFHITQLAILDKSLQRLLMETKCYIDNLNEQIDSTKFFYKKTFDSSLSIENRNIIETNRHNTYIEIMKLAKRTIEIIDKLLSEPGFI